jgi:hypothetical protein
MTPKQIVNHPISNGFMTIGLRPAEAYVEMKGDSEESKTTNLENAIGHFSRTVRRKNQSGRTKVAVTL